MSQRIVLTAIMIALTLTAGSAWAEEQEDLVDVVAKACQKEIDNFCSQVTPGEQRLLACFYAHGDKLSGRCEYALYKAAALLEEFAAALTHVAMECRDDLEKHCADVELGEGRVMSCLVKSDVSKACRQAIEDSEIEVYE